MPLTVIFGIGVLGTISFVYMALTGTGLIDGIFPERFLKILLLAVPALGLLYTGVWLSTGNFTPAEIWRIGVYATVAVVVASVGVGLSLLAVPLSGLGLRETFFLFISTGTEGAFFGVLFGVIRVTDLLRQSIREQERRRERLARRNERLERFAGVVSHDLRSPLSVAEGRLDLAQDECDSEHFEDIERAHERMKTLIEDLLTLARQGEAVADPEPVDLDGIVESCWANVRTRNATVVVGVERSVEADRGRLRRLLENLFRNAIEHGGEDVTVTVGPLPDGFYVEDDGPGIPADDRDDVFDAGYSTRRDGAGYGLNIVKRIVEAHGWRIRITEGAGGGARFEIVGVEFTAE